MQEHKVAKGIEQVLVATARTSDADAEADAAPSRERPWVAPAAWTEDPAPRLMRLATYMAPDPAGPVEVAITRFGGIVGGELANINRWRGQMGLGPIGEDELGTSISRFSAAGFDGYEIRIESPRGVMLAAGVYQKAIDQMWFVRTTVPDAEVADRFEDAVFGMARSIAGLDNEDDE
ncbi:MAG: hypothetical protein KF902_02575 [Phycisphaeraceae bacterium]|nr:hypothetical protein [Phycisphaeraceae bacterium]MCW5769662.1 hypothetical protein [Phycisphaeraceae bacterium]